MTFVIPEDERCPGCGVRYAGHEGAAKTCGVGGPVVHLISRGDSRDEQRGRCLRCDPYNADEVADHDAKSCNA